MLRKSGGKNKSITVPFDECCQVVHVIRRHSALGFGGCYRAKQAPTQPADDSSDGLRKDQRDALMRVSRVMAKEACFSVGKFGARNRGMQSLVKDIKKD